MSAPAAALALGVHPRTARKWIRTGRLAGRELGARCWTTAAAVAALAAACGASGVSGELEDLRTPPASSSSARKAPAGSAGRRK